MSELLSILLPALAAGCLVILSHVPLGYQVLNRGIIFIDLAIAQFAALGIVLCHQFHWHESFHGVEYLVAVSFALAGAGLFAFLEKHLKEELEAIIGCCYVLAATGALLALSHDPHGGELLKQTLSGSILWVTWDLLLWHGVLVATLLVAMLWRPAWLRGFGFYPIFALAITSAVELVGVYLVFASLIMLPLVTRHFSHGFRRLSMAYGLSLLAYLFGLVVSAWWDLPSGATLVWSLAFVALLFVSLARPATR